MSIADPRVPGTHDPDGAVAQERAANRFDGLHPGNEDARPGTFDGRGDHPAATGRLRHVALMNRDPKFLYLQLRWFTRLRWIAGLMVIAVAIADVQIMHAYAASPKMLKLGFGVLGYNAVLWWFLHAFLGIQGKRSGLLLLAWAQLLLDLGSLTMLVLWTGGVHSPIAGFFVFQMVFASLLLPR